jgi:hypothetical protein
VTPDEPEAVPFVPRHGRVDTNRPPTPDELAECRRLAREGSNALASRAKYVKPPQLTDAEAAALARKRADQEATR